METRETIVIPREEDAYDALISNKHLFENYLVIAHKNFSKHLKSIDGVIVQPLPKINWDVLFIDDVELFPRFCHVIAIKYDERISKRWIVIIPPSYAWGGVLFK